MSIFNLLIVVLLNAFFAWGSRSGQPRVKIENGFVLGKHSTSHNGNEYQSFEGIPYAKPPIDDKRFTEPEPIRGSWIGEWNATEPGSPCLQYSQVARTRNENGDWMYSVIGDEDCLFLNVYTKDGYTNKDVIFFIHGGAFMFGSGDSNGPEYLMDNDDVVVVTFNYRLGPLGFLTTGDSIAPGNFGLKDQVVALEWVNRNIDAFGGNPERVTIVGMSAGGASVHYHFLSDLSRGLFHKGYSYSGSALCPWAFVRDGVEKTHQLARYLGCPTTDSKTMIKCMRRRPARKIVKQINNFMNWKYNPFTVFGPVKEVKSAQPFIDDEPQNLLLRGKVQDLPWMAGFTADEGLYPAADFIEEETSLSHLDKNWNSLAPSLLFYEEHSVGKEVATAIREHYLGAKPLTVDTGKKLVKMLSDRLFIAPIVEAASLQSQANMQPVFVYSYEHEGDRSLSQLLSPTNSSLGSSHGDDFIHVFKLSGVSNPVTEEGKAMTDLLCGILLNYIKKDEPPQSLGWKPASKGNLGQIQLLRILSADDTRMEIGDNVGNVMFMKKLFDISLATKDEL